MKTILIIDDDKYLLEAIQDNLELENFNTLIAESGMEGIKLARIHKPDLIICDLMMPQMDGYRVLKELKKSPETAIIPFIFLTAQGEKEDLRRGMNSGADDYIIKPFDASELLRAINSIFEKREKLLWAIKSASNTLQHHIFLSYSRKDAPIMQRLRDDLRETELKVWVDEEGLEPGTPAWEQAIAIAIRESGCLVVVLSPDAERSVWVGRELAMADTLDKRIFPILARGSEKDAIPFRLMTHQLVDARHNYSEAFEKLSGAVKKYLGVG